MQQPPSFIGVRDSSALPVRSSLLKRSRSSVGFVLQSRLEPQGRLQCRKSGKGMLGTSQVAGLGHGHTCVSAGSPRVHKLRAQEPTGDKLKAVARSGVATCVLPTCLFATCPVTTNWIATDWVPTCRVAKHGSTGGSSSSRPSSSRICSAGEADGRPRRGKQRVGEVGEKPLSRLRLTRRWRDSLGFNPQNAVGARGLRVYWRPFVFGRLRRPFLEGGPCLSPSSDDEFCSSCRSPNAALHSAAVIANRFD